MKTKNTFLKTVCALAIPVTLQSILQSSFSIVDQIMIGQLGSVSVAGVGLAGKFSSIYSVIVSAVGAVAGIMISQYLGQKNKYEVKRSFGINLLLGIVIAALFTIVCGLFPIQIMNLYTKDVATAKAAAEYLVVISLTFLPIAGATILSTLLRCMEMAQFPLYVSIVSAIANTGLNYVLIFGKCGFMPMGAKGAAIATVVSQFLNFFLMLVVFCRKRTLLAVCDAAIVEKRSYHWRQYITMLLPILACEVAWSLGENVYAIIYGHMGTNQMAAMTLINPVQGIVIGALCGLSQAAGVIIGKRLGSEEYEDAYISSKKLLWYGFVGSVLLSVLVVLTANQYVGIYQVENVVKELTKQILFAYALIAPFKVLNMILGGGIIRSGGLTKYTMYIDIIGTWCFGVPFGLFAGFVLDLSIPYVYFILSLEECIRFIISLFIFRSRKWMNCLEASTENQIGE